MFEKEKSMSRLIIINMIYVLHDSNQIERALELYHKAYKHGHVNHMDKVCNIFLFS